MSSIESKHDGCENKMRNKKCVIISIIQMTLHNDSVKITEVVET